MWTLQKCGMTMDFLEEVFDKEVYESLLAHEV